MCIGDGGNFTGSRQDETQGGRREDERRTYTAVLSVAPISSYVSEETKFMVLLIKLEAVKEALRLVRHDRSLGNTCTNCCSLHLISN